LPVDIGFRCSFLLNFIIVYLIVVYSSYKISLRNFERIRAAIGKLYFIGGVYGWISDSGAVCCLILLLSISL
jgi:hypothetical protein